MDLLKQSYDDSTSSSDSPDDPNDDLCADYLGLTYTALDEELHLDIEKKYAVLRETSSIIEDAFVLSASPAGPQDNTQSSVQVDYNSAAAETLPLSKSVEVTSEFSLNRELEFENYKHDLVLSSNKTGMNICWEKILQIRITKDKRCKPPGHSSSHQLSEKCLSSVQWNRNFSNLLLSTSFDGCIRVWDYASRKVLITLPLHQGGVKSGVWSLDGRAIFSGGFDKFARLTDLLTGQKLMVCSHQQMVSSVQTHPAHNHLFLTGSFNCISAWDMRSPPTTPIRTFKSNCKQILCMAFLPGEEEEFVCSTEVVSQDSADRTIMVWHFPSSAILSNQIYQERFQCPWLCVDPERHKFLAQSSGNYIAEFSASRPYKMNKHRKYESHNIAGYGIGCCLSEDYSLLASGDAQGDVCIYRVGFPNLLRRLACPSTLPDPSICLDWHPRLASLLAVGTWSGALRFWK